MRQRLLITLAALMVVLLATPAPTPTPVTAQDDGGWSLYMLDADQRQLIAVDQRGNATPRPLPVGDNTFVGPGDLAISPAGDRVAFTAFTYNTDGTATQTLTVQDLTTDALLFARDFADIEDFRASAFDPAGERVVLGVVNQLFVGQADAGDGPLWSLLVLDAQSGDTLARLDSNAAAVEALPDRLPDIAYMPLAVDFSGDTLAITQVPWIGAGIDETFGFEWDISAGDEAVTDAPRFASSILTRNTATGEIAQIVLDTEAPTAAANMPMLPFNAVEIVRDGARRVVFRSAESIVLDVRFIANGERLAIQLLQGDRSSQRTKWVVLDRDGTIRDLTTFAENVFTEIRPAPNGFVTLTTTYPPGFTDPPEVLLTYGGDGQPVTLWEGSGDYYSIVWTAPHPDDGFAPFAAAE